MKSGLKYTLNIICRLEQNVFKRFLKTLSDTQQRMSIGREFQSLGAHEENALSPYEENVFSVKRRSLSDDLNVRVDTYGVRSSFM